MKILFALPVVVFVMAVSHAFATDSDLSIQDRVMKAEKISGELVKKLGKTLKAEISESGPEGAIKVCREAAPSIASVISLENGWRVTRVSLRARNSMLGSPDAWEQRVLLDFQQRVDNGEPIKSMAYHEVVEEPAGGTFRYMKAIGTGPLCLSCHGNADQVPEKILNQLQSLYPHDNALGYRLNDIRGAISIKQPL